MARLRFAQWRICRRWFAPASSGAPRPRRLERLFYKQRADLQRRHTMRYMLLIHRDEESAMAATASTEQKEETITRVWSVIDEMTKRGVFRASEPLERAGNATVVRFQNGKALTTDG